MDELLSYDPTAFPLAAYSSHWRKYRNPAETGGAGGLTQKIGAQNRGTGQKDIIKTGWPGTSVKELTWSRLARVIGLPAALVQLHLARRSSPSSLDVLIWLVESTSADWLWTATTLDMQAKGVDVTLVSRLKAFVIWTSAAGANEIGEFRLAQDGTPFVVDHQDSLFVGSLMTSGPIAQRIPPDTVQRQAATEFWYGLTDQVRRGWPLLEAAHRWPPLFGPDAQPMSMGCHLERLIEARAPDRFKL